MPRWSNLEENSMEQSRARTRMRMFITLQLQQIIARVEKRR